MEPISKDFLQEPISKNFSILIHPMKNKNLRVFVLLLLVFGSAMFADTSEWKANWITETFAQNESNSWFCLRKDFELESVPAVAIAKIAVDSKYWLWVNGEMVLFEGGLKRGPNPMDTYYDEVDIAPFLKNGKNTLAVLAWYFGKDGFSHISSGTFGFLFECIAPEVEILSDRSWKVRRHPAYETCHYPPPNFRLPESSIRFDARRDLGDWFAPDYDAAGQWMPATVVGNVPCEPWNELVERPIPQWKNSGLIDYVNAMEYPFVCEEEQQFVCELPANLQITPYLKVEAPEGAVIDIRTDHFIGGSQNNLRAEYVTKKGIQAYESFGWMNGHKVIYTIPKGVKVLELKYRETGYDTAFAGSFSSSDVFLNRIWQKSLRTLYVTMRDNYMDCPDRERAQWFGDEVHEAGEAFYALDVNSHALFKKGMYELIGWQREDHSLFSPVPAGNYADELPSQMLTSIGHYGFWNYYLHTGDLETLADLYDGVVKYLSIWQLHENGTLMFREGGWTWGDWGENRDLEGIFNTTYYLALDGVKRMADALGKTSEAAAFEKQLVSFREAFNSHFWTGSCYRHPEYVGETDDRVQALAVVAGLVDPAKFPALFEVFKVDEHASPYMEKYVLEALFQMGYEGYAIERMKKRFGYMVNHPDYSTLFEGWGLGAEGFGGGTANHAWSGGALTLLSQYLCGIAPVEPGYSVFHILPQPAGIEQASATVQSVKGRIVSSFKAESGRFILDVEIPEGTEAMVGIPNNGYRSIQVNGSEAWREGRALPDRSVRSCEFTDESRHQIFRVQSGIWRFEATK